MAIACWCPSQSLYVATHSFLLELDWSDMAVRQTIELYTGDPVSNLTVVADQTVRTQVTVPQWDVPWVMLSTMLAGVFR